VIVVVVVTPRHVPVPRPAGERAGRGCAGLRRAHSHRDGRRHLLGVVVRRQMLLLLLLLRRLLL
jgi:hypothetical protein